jgi:CBS domain-containing protein
MRQTAQKVRVIAVQDLMTRDVMTCRPDDMLDVPARIMWDHDCGCIPVVDESERVVGMITDRDICMATYTQGIALGALRVSNAMSGQVHACRPEDTIAVAERTMREHRVRRLPVVASDGRLVGILSINDLAREAAREHVPPRREVSPEGLTETLAAVCEPRMSRGTAAAV